MDTEMRVRNAYQAMRGRDIPPDEVTQVLKDLTKIYSWSCIEAENYKLLADEIVKVPAAEQPKCGVDAQAAANSWLEVINSQNAFERLRRKYEKGQMFLPACSNGQTPALFVRPNELGEPLPHKLDPVAVNTMVDTYPSLGKGQGKIFKDSSATALIEKSDKDMPLVASSVAVLRQDLSKEVDFSSRDGTAKGEHQPELSYSASSRKTPAAIEPKNNTLFTPVQRRRSSRISKSNNYKELSTYGKRKRTQLTTDDINSVDFGVNVQKKSSCPDRAKANVDEVAVVLHVDAVTQEKGKLMSVDEKVQSPKATKRKTTEISKPLNAKFDLIDDNTGYGSDSEYAVPSLFHNFYYEKNRNEWHKFENKNPWPEQNINISDAEKHGLKEFLDDRKFLKSLTIIGVYQVMVIRYCSANICPQTCNPKSRKYGQLFFRDHVYNISPRVVNKTVGRVDCADVEFTLNDMDMIAEFLTGGNIKKWQSPFKVISLTTLYACLHKITITNWLPTANDHRVSIEQACFLYKLGMNLPINFGKMVFDHFTDLTKIESRAYIPYPSLIYNILLEQGFKPDEGEEFTKRPSFFKVSPILLRGGYRKNDLPYIKNVDLAVGDTATKMDVSRASRKSISMQEFNLTKKSEDFTRKPTRYDDHAKNLTGVKGKKGGGVNVGGTATKVFTEHLSRKYLLCQLQKLDRSMERTKQILKDLEQEKNEVLALLGNDHGDGDGDGDDDEDVDVNGD